MSDFGDELCRLLAERGMSQRELARLSHYDSGHVNKLCKGVKQPTLEAAARLGEVLGAGDALTALVNPRQAFGQMLDRLIRQSGAAAKDIARQVPCNAGHLSRLRQGKKRPSFQVAGRLDEILGAGGELVAAAVRDSLPAELARFAALPARTAPEIPAQTDQLVDALRALSARVDALTEALNTASYRVPGAASGRRAPLYLVQPPDEAG